MNQSLHVGATLLATPHPHITKQVNSVSVITSAVIALAGVLLVYFPLVIDESSSTLSMLLLTIGTILILAALYCLFWKSTSMVYTPTGGVLREASCFTEADDLPVLQRMLEKKVFEQAPTVTFKQSGNGRMDYLISKDGKFAAVQLFRFIPYTYEPVSDIYYYTDADATAFLHFMETRNN